MLFVLSGGVPSVGAWVRIDPSVGGTPVSPPSSPPTNITDLTAGLYHFNNVGRCSGHSLVCQSSQEDNAAFQRLSLAPIASKTSLFSVPPCACMILQGWL